MNKVLFLLVVLCASSFADKTTLKVTQNLSKNHLSGTNAIEHSAPWMVSIEISEHPGLTTREHRCSGSIIHPNWILTSAQCLVDLPIGSRVEIIAGIFNLFALSPDTQIRYAAQLFTHTSYGLDETSDDNDIGMIKLNIPFKWSNNIQPIDVDIDGVQVDDTGIFYGWSRDKAALHFCDLQASLRKIISTAECNSAVNLTNKIDSSQLCSQSLDICSTADHGGAFVNFGSKGIPKLAGIWIYDICENGINIPVYSYVSKFVDWIDATVRENSYISHSWRKPKK